MSSHSELVDTWSQSLTSEIRVSLLPPWTHSGKLLDHCVHNIQMFRKGLGGLPLCVYKIGITSDLNQRWLSYRDQNFKRMLCVHATNNLSTVEHMEAALILIFKQEMEGAIRNVNKGGEGMRLKDGTARFQPPYFVYCVGADASQRELLLG